MALTTSSKWLYANDPARFAREILGFQPDLNQSAVLGVETRRGILACHRQWGKSTTAAIKAIHHAMFHDDSLSIIVAPTLRQGCLLLDTIQRFARKLELSVKPDAYKRPSLVLPNGARLVALPAEEANIRGFSAVSLLLIDEAARVPDEVWAAILPTVSTVDGSVWLMSTPKGKQGFFADIWHGGGSAWHRIRATAENTARISPEVLADQRRSLSRHQFAQDYLCEFGDTEDQVFRSAVVEPAFSNAFEPLDTGRYWRQDPYRPGTTELSYFVGLDLGQSQDHTALAVVELHSWHNGWRDAATLEHLQDTTLRVRLLERLPLGTPYPDVLAKLGRTVEYLGTRTVVVADATGLGAPFLDFLRASSLRLCADWPARSPRELKAAANQYQQYGYLLPVTITSGGIAAPGPRGGYHVPKVDLIESLERVFGSGRLEICARLEHADALKAELLSLRRDGNRFEPRSSLVHDDLLMALSLAIWRIGRQRKDLLQPAPERLKRPA